MAAPKVLITIGEARFTASLLAERAPRTCARFLALLPWSRQIIHARWSGEACWIPLGDLDLGLGFENATSHPRPGEFILYPGGISETEILMAYGVVRFSSKSGPLAGNPFLRVDDRADELAALARSTLWNGALPIGFELEA